jgi:hypothetical protein
MRPVEHLRHLADDGCSRRVRELGQFFQVLAELLARARGLDRCPDENGALLGRMEID